MFELFTDRARRVVVLAQDEARELNHDYIGTEHLLLGLLREPEGVAAQALAAMGVELDGVRDRVVATTGRGEDAPSGHIPFTPRAKKVLELSLRESKHLGHNYIGTEHLLLGLVREGEGVAAQVLVGLGADLNRVRQQVIQLLHGARGEGPAAAREPAVPPRAQLVDLQRMDEVMARLDVIAGGLDEITRRLAGLDARLAAVERHLGVGGPPAAASG